MHISELNYELPEELIAQHPAQQRDAARLMIVDRRTGSIATDVFRNLPRYVASGDCLVLNDTRVIPARLHGTKETGGAVEIFLLKELSPGEWEALVRPSARIKNGTQVEIGSRLRATVLEQLPGGRRRVMFDTQNVLQVLEESGEIPLPPYIQRDRPEADDRVRYQTIYANKPGAVAAPTAGLHYTSGVFEALEQQGIDWTWITLHVGYGTFKPVQAERIEDHVVDPEEFVISGATAAKLNAVRARGNRVVAAGTTCTRVLETQYHGGKFVPGAGFTGTYIHPPYQFQAVDALQTNFHLPRSSLLALVFAFGGVDLIREAYQRAIAERFRFYSYGDTMLIL